jgi:hypothetical protein
MTDWAAKKWSRDTSGIPDKPTPPPTPPPVSVPKRHPSTDGLTDAQIQVGKDVYGHDPVNPTPEAEAYWGRQPRPTPPGGMSVGR